MRKLDNSSMVSENTPVESLSSPFFLAMGLLDGY